MLYSRLKVTSPKSETTDVPIPNTTELLSHLPFGGPGDHLTAKCACAGVCIRPILLIPLKMLITDLEGLLLVAEDWHTKVVFLVEVLS